MTLSMAVQQMVAVPLRGSGQGKIENIYLNFSFRWCRRPLAGKWSRKEVLHLLARPADLVSPSPCGEVVKERISRTTARTRTNRRRPLAGKWSRKAVTMPNLSETS